MKVGFIGLGNMGMPMAANVLSRGFELHLYNRTGSKAAPLLARGAHMADSPADLTRRVDILLACLTDIRASREVFLGAGGVLSAARPGQILADHSTVDPETSRQCYRAAKRQGARFLDAPISGGPEGAQTGRLTIMVGGDEDSFQNAQPVFRSLGQTIVYMGGSGAGSVTKLVNQILVGVHTLACCEAMLLGVESGVDSRRLAQVLMQSWGASRMLQRNAPLIAKREFGPSAAPIRNLVKDLGIIVELGRKMGLSFPAMKQAERINRLALEQGMALHDITAVYQLLESARSDVQSDVNLPCCHEP